MLQGVAYRPQINLLGWVDLDFGCSLGWDKTYTCRDSYSSGPGAPLFPQTYFTQSQANAKVRQPVRSMVVESELGHRGLIFL